MSVRPTSGTVATSLPHSASVFRASALTFRFTLPVSKHTRRHCGSRPVSITAPFPRGTVVVCVQRQNRLPSASQANSLSSLCFPSSPFPITFALINPHLLPYYSTRLCLPPPPSFHHSPQSFTRRTSTDRPLRERFLTVSSEILPDLLVQVIVSIPLRGR